MTSRRGLVAVLAGLLAVTGCGGSAEDAFSAATPDLEGLTLETSGANESALGLEARTGALAAATGACEKYEYLCNIHEVVSGLNAYVRAAVAPIQALALTVPTSVDGDTKVYGPVDAPLAPATAVASFKLTVQRVNPTTFRWKLEGKPVAGGDFSVIAAGTMRRAASDLAHRGRGAIGIDLDALYALNPAGAAPVWNGQGKLLVGFRHLGRAKSVAYAVRDFTPDRATVPVVTAAALVGHKTPAGVARVRIVSVNDLAAPAGGGTSAGDELLLSRAAWFPGLGGRAVVAVLGGDVPSYGAQLLLGLSCYDALEHEVFRALYACGTLGCALVQDAPAGFNVGSPSACVPGTDVGVDASNPPSANPDLGSRQSEPGAPVDADPPPASMAEVLF